jgi:lipopolysaccharide/colanic/teichoic acid biosynthesis glycosyltransferase
VKILAFLLTAVFVPVLVNECTDWLPWLAARLVGAAARTMPSAVRERYTDEWLAELDATPGKLSKLAVAIRIFARAPATSAIISGVRSLMSSMGKTVLDRTAAACALVLLAPAMAGVALAIKVTDNGPVFSRHGRIGKDGRPFKLWVFRTRVTTAQELLAQYRVWIDSGRPLVNERRPVGFTRLGAWLRRWSIDEMPQLLNVLSGDMSLVGPRPARPADVAAYTDDMRRRLEAKPGITGLWQITGRSDEPRDAMAKVDLRYVENRSFAVDMQILWRTLRAGLSAVFRSRRRH